jgi:bifunctional non-homologous end joining protein LigD
MALESYRRKRDFQTTPEPAGEVGATAGNTFVIQKHAARRLHYDLRLEMDGVLKSWAVTRGPSLVPGEKRLAVHVEDHPLDYGDFEGTIPKGQYGGGTVIVWDRGTWSPVADPDKGYAKGHLEFALQGEKLQGRWHLVRIKGKPGEKRENWLLIKGEDEAARSEDAPDILEEMPLSVKSGLDLAEVAKGVAPKTPKAAKTPKGAKSAKPRKPASKVELPDFVPPMLASLVATTPKDDRWLHEIKFDGYRLQARIAGGKARLLTRSGLDWTDRLAPIAEVLGGLADQALVDGELVVESGSGATDFSALQADLAEGRGDRLVFYAFDLMHLDGEDLRKLPLTERKARLEPLLNGAPAALRYSEHFDDGGEIVLRHACRLGLEGVVSKLRDSPYRSGRGRSWVKSKCSARQEFVVAGYVPSSVSDSAIGSLVLGVFEDGALHHVGRVGTGFSNHTARDLFARLQPMEIRETPFAKRLTAEEARGARFVTPELVAEVEFRAWTADGHLRHASFRGLREDKPATEVMREAAPKAKPAPEPKRRVKLTHPDRVYWPDVGLTKAGLADHYAEVWPLIAPHLIGRPLALLRCPDGIDGQQFFQKHAWKGMNPNILTPEDPGDPGEGLIAVGDLDGLLGLVQSAALEIHPWGSTLADIERPDRIVIDLDPGEGVGWEAMIEAAHEVRERVEAAGLAAFLKTSGGKGLHVVAPLKPKAEWPAVKAWCQALAKAMAADQPDRYVATIAKAKRTGKILVDYLRNQRGATAVAPWSTRARPGAAVSTPIAWEELGPAIGPAHFTVQNLPARLSAGADPWSDFYAAATPLPKA